MAAFKPPHTCSQELETLFAQLCSASKASAVASPWDSSATTQLALLELRYPGITLSLLQQRKRQQEGDAGAAGDLIFCLCCLRNEGSAAGCTLPGSFWDVISKHRAAAEAASSNAEQGAAAALTALRHDAGGGHARRQPRRKAAKAAIQRFQVEGVTGKRRRARSLSGSGLSSGAETRRRSQIRDALEWLKEAAAAKKSMKIRRRVERLEERVRRCAELLRGGGSSGGGEESESEEEKEEAVAALLAHRMVPQKSV